MNTNDNEKPAHAPVVLRPAELPRYDRGGGNSTIPLVSPQYGAEVFVSVITEIAPGSNIAFHSHNCEESVVVLEGQASFELESGETTLLDVHDTTWIPPKISHRFRNPTTSTPLKILGIYGSTTATRRNSATGETRLVSSEHATALPR